MLEITDLSINYGGIQALQNINLTVNSGEVVTLIGANGAGKSTTLRAISRLIRPRSGQILYDGRDITQARPHEVVRLGIAQCPEGRRVLARLSVLDNLELGAYGRTDRAAKKVQNKRVGKGGMVQDIEVDYKAVLAGKIADPELKEGDVVVVKESFF